ncbi:hypothetical protein CWB85_02990 [Pseudoalteromonas sp. S1727]|nr:hypothetical protein CWB85_02990 [Pseudoalteromonas sp. S1727]
MLAFNMGSKNKIPRADMHNCQNILETSDLKEQSYFPMSAIENIEHGVKGLKKPAEAGFFSSGDY